MAATSGGVVGDTMRIKAPRECRSAGSAGLQRRHNIADRVLGDVHQQVMAAMVAPSIEAAVDHGISPGAGGKKASMS